MSNYVCVCVCVCAHANEGVTAACPRCAALDSLTPSLHGLNGLFITTIRRSERVRREASSDASSTPALEDNDVSPGACSALTGNTVPLDK